ncbi:hypothetical protein FB45DRAFT_929636 [Roridomyces roridus]|uniref:Secreted protein n=1 Tax=Roridomyces roridus TaxID=1738132 RepID=A0AAD7FEZ6_9AGAR|nr:hypothetical protein FB45DRAFT_929636 [Roridomyces roridus]
MRRFLELPILTGMLVLVILPPVAAVCCVTPPCPEALTRRAAIPRLMNPNPLPLESESESLEPDVGGCCCAAGTVDLCETRCLE